MARIPPDLPTTAPIPAARPSTVSFTTEQPSAYRGGTLAALMQRRKELAAQQNALAGQQIQHPMQGWGMLANQLVTGLQERSAANQEEAGRELLSKTVAGIDWDKGPTPEQQSIIGKIDPDMQVAFIKEMLDARRAAAKVDSYGPVITGEQATTLGLDPAKSYQLNMTTGQYDQVGGGGISVNTGDKLTDSLSKDTVFYPGALAANMDLEEMDTQLASAANAAGGMLPGGNFLQTPEYQQARIAGDAWIQNVLRKESGATIPAEEMESYRKTYLPQPGDDTKTIEYKRQLREERTRTMRYGLEAGAPETLKKIDEDFAARKAARAKAKAEKNQPAPPDASGGGSGAPTPTDPNTPADPNTPPSPTKKIKSVVDNGDGTFTVTYDDGTTVTKKAGTK